MIALGTLLAFTLAAGGCRAIDGERILARDLAEAVPEFAALAPETTVGYAPAPGARRVFRADELGRLAKLHGIQLGGAAGACFEWRLWLPGREDLMAAMRASLNAPEARIEILETSRQAGPRGEAVFPRSGLAAPSPARPEAATLWRGYIRYDGERKFAIWARARIRVAHVRAVSLQALPAGAPIRANQIRMERAEEFPSATASGEVVGWIPRRPIAAGRVLTGALLDPPKEILRGDAVRVQVQSGAARIVADAIAETAGGRGETILLRNRESGKKFAAVVQGKGQAAVRVKGD
jgi:flagella basal body P-ring formation protein FlgA